MSCPNCGKELMEASQTCPHCGTTIETPAERPATPTGTPAGAEPKPRRSLLSGVVGPLAVFYFLFTAMEAYSKGQVVTASFFVLTSGLVLLMVNPRNIRARLGLPNGRAVMLGLTAAAMAVLLLGGLLQRYA